MKDLVLVATFRNCIVRMGYNGWYTETVFHDGTKVSATPTRTPEQMETALRLGYGEDVAALCREHEILHTWLCERFGLPYSPTLWAVAHGQGDGCVALHHQQEEETLVLAFQAYLNGRDENAAALRSLIDRGLCLDALRGDALPLLRPSARAKAA